MSKALSAIIVAAAFIFGAVAVGHSQSVKFSPYADEDGAISLPNHEVVRARWTSLGSWTVIADSAAESIHTVYTQPGSVERFRLDGKFPDGTVLVKEVREAATADMTTGRVARNGDLLHWFVMIKDAHDRYKGNPLWGNGWGWALFLADDPKTNVTSDFRDDCLTCHIPAKMTDWVYTEGYPVLNR